MIRFLYMQNKLKKQKFIFVEIKENKGRETWTIFDIKENKKIAKFYDLRLACNVAIYLEDYLCKIYKKINE